MDETWNAAMAARDSGITVIAIGVGSSVRYTELRGIASSPASATIFQVQQFDQLPNQISSLRNLVCRSE